MKGKKILIFCCEHCSYAAADKAGKSKLMYPAYTRIVRLPCTGRVHLEMVVDALERYDGVLILGCHPGDCHFKVGNVKAYLRIFLLKKMFKILGIDERRFDIDWASSVEDKRFVELVNNFVNRIEGIRE